MVVVGDAGAGSIFCLDLYTRQTRFVARVAAPSGMALRRAPDSQRLVYVTDAAAHRLYVVDIDSLASSTVAGNPPPTAPEAFVGGRSMSWMCQHVGGN